MRFACSSAASPIREVAYVCGRLVLETADGSNREGVYWRYELAQRAAESRLGSITGGNGSIYAVRRSDYVEVDPRLGHDLSFPYLMVQAGRRAVYEPAARAFEKPTPTNETEYRRKVRMFEHCWEIVLRGSMLRRLPPGYLAAVISHRLLRYGSGVLHVVLLAASVALVGEGWLYQAALAAQLLLLAAAALGVGLARYYVLVTWATLVALWNYLRRGVPATWTPPRDERGERRGRRDPIGGCPMNIPSHTISAREAAARDVNRALDVAIAGTGLVLTSPLLAASALAVKLDDRGPILYRQARVGRDGRDFELLKLRTMIVGAERQGAGYAVAAGDSRITRIGRFLRRTSLDELPQLWNVVRGEMSLIGPRPTLRYQVEQYDERQRRRLEIRPGITGWAQIHGRATLPWEERIELDLWYVDHRSWKTDLLILLRTPLALFGGTYKGETGGWRG